MCLLKPAWATESSGKQAARRARSADRGCYGVARGVYLHECDEQEEGVGSPPDLLIQEPRQEGENPILGRTAEGDKGKGNVTRCLHSRRWRQRASYCISKCRNAYINCVLMICFHLAALNSITLKVE